jgi:hypothetical protein
VIHGSVTTGAPRPSERLTASTRDSKALDVELVKGLGVDLATGGERAIPRNGMDGELCVPADGQIRFATEHLGRDNQRARNPSDTFHEAQRVLGSTGAPLLGRCARARCHDQ